jgi:hypothetical protein
VIQAERHLEEATAARDGKQAATYPGGSASPGIYMPAGPVPSASVTCELAHASRRRVQQEAGAQEFERADSRLKRFSKRSREPDQGEVDGAAGGPGKKLYPPSWA